MSNQVRCRLYRAAAFLLPALFVAAAASAQQPSKAANTTYVRQLEANGWNAVDTIVTFDPEGGV